jgi:hypothetical protein
VVGYRDREEDRGAEEECEKRPRGFWFQVMENLIGRLDTGQDLGSEKQAK